MRIAPLAVLALLTGCAVAQSPVPDAFFVPADDGGQPPPLDRDVPPADAGPRDMDAPDPDGEIRPEPDADLDPDAGAPPEPDAAPPAPDAAPPDLDAAPPEPDMMVPEPDMAPPPPVDYPWLIVVDNSAVENMRGTPGVDICGASAACGDGPVTAIDVDFIAGDGRICDGVPDGVCGETARDDALATLDDGAACEPASSPSHYTSLGVSGQLALQFEDTLRGCTVEIVEFAGADIEAYEVYVCQTSTLEAETCLDDGRAVAVAGQGGNLSVEVP